MPRIPQLTDNTIQTQVVSQPRASSNTAPGAFSNPLVNAGVQAATLYAQQKQKVAITAAEQAALEFEKRKNDILFNPDSGYFNTQGRDAYDKAPTVREQLLKIKNEYNGKFGSTEAQQAFDRVTQQQIESADVDVMRHSAKNLEAWEIGTIKAQVENTVENASNYWNNPEKLMVQNALGRQAVIDAADREGISAIEKNERLQTYDSAFHQAAIEAAVVRSAGQGKALLDQYRDRLEGPAADRLQLAIETKLKADSEKNRAAIVNTAATRLVQQYGDFDDARNRILDQVEKVSDPEVRRDLVREADYLLDQRNRANAEARGKYYENAEAYVLEGGSVNEYIARNPDAWQSLSPKQRQQLKSGVAVETDYNTFSEVMLLPKEKLAKVDPSAYFPKLGLTERKQLISAVESARTGKDDQPIGRTRIEQTKSAAEQIFGDSKDWEKDKLVRVNQFYNLVDIEAKSRESIKGAPLTSAEYTDVLQGMTREAVKKGRIYDSTYNLDTVLEKIPADQLQQITEYLKSQGVIVSTDNILRAYEQATK